ncbi:glycine/D-amino acid oxidase-like deaminating enzyme [Peptoniphilus olsenii]|uniref:Glycine/D-amino acid oxidase-like deaminating enzyme n=1 Tax=Peptoniphilus olsenii TaxID=411570 RepID=A0ABV2JC27_9FIRM
MDKKIKIKSQYSYAAIFGESKDDLPYIGLHKNNKNIMAICGAGGNGTIYSTIASEFALDWLNGKDISDYDIFSLDR